MPALYEILLARSGTLDEQLLILGKLVEVHGHQLQDREAAFEWARKAYERAPDREGALAAFEQVARPAAQWQGFVDAVNARLAALESSIEGTRSGKKKKKKDKENGDNGRREEMGCSSERSSPRCTRVRWGGSTKPSPPTGRS